MDQHLRKYLQTTSQKVHQGGQFAPCFFVWIGLVATSMLVSQTGCTFPSLTNREIPAPPLQLDKTALDSVRFQSSDRNAGSGVRSSAATSATKPKRPSGSVELYFPGGEQSAGGAPDKSNVIAEVILQGNKTISTQQLRSSMQTRPGRYFDPDRLQQDIDALWRMSEISRINGPFLKHTPEGVIVTIEVVERSTIGEIQFVGNRGITDRKLKGESGLQDGAPLDVHAIRAAKTKIEEFYKERGYPRTQVEIIEGNEKSDSKVTFLIHEDQQQRIWNVEFEGNKIASDARLRHFIQSKPGILKVFGGLVKRDEIEQDIVRLTTYYRSLGFFNARIGREITESNDGRWLTLRFIINEGPRYRVRNVAFVGNSAFSSEQLITQVGLKPQIADDSESESDSDSEFMPEFKVTEMNTDVRALRELYGAQGFVFASVEAEPRFLEEPGLLDIVYIIDEGEQYLVGNINIHFVGGQGITRRQAILNPLSLRPGDLININEVRASEARLGRSQIFAGPGTPGAQPPRIVVRPQGEEFVERTARAPSRRSPPRGGPPSGGSSSRGPTSGSSFR